ncbi:MAG: hypothetical protein NT028_06140, partial [candidate division Zixibacteria bacterium]|nr:hypothetical protein [candidate division Zixibacteria bacterium]
REDLIHLDSISAQAKLLGKNKIDMAEQLTAYRTNVESQINQLTAERKTLSNEKRRVVNQDRKAELSVQISDISSQLKPLRRERALCDTIFEYSVLIKEKEEHLKTLIERKEMKEHESGGRGRSSREHGS